MLREYAHTEIEDVTTFSIGVRSQSIKNVQWTRVCISNDFLLAGHEAGTGLETLITPIHRPGSSRCHIGLVFEP